MSMTLEQYITNPMGKNNAVLSAITRESIRKDYSNRFNNVLLRENGNINHFIYKDRKNNVYYVHVRVPSEVIPRFYYDVVFKFFADASIKDGGRSLENYYVQFYSNDPAFVFTYAHTFMSNGLFIKELASKMSKEAIKHKAKEKNPQNLNGYVKSLYFGYLFLKQRGLLNKIKFEDAPEFNIASLANNIMPADQKIELRQQEESKRDKRKKVQVDKDTLRRINRIGVSDKAAERLVTTTRNVQKVKNTTAVNMVKSSRKVGKK